VCPRMDRQKMGYGMELCSAANRTYSSGILACLGSRMFVWQSAFRVLVTNRAHEGSVMRNPQLSGRWLLSLAETAAPQQTQSANFESGASPINSRLTTGSSQLRTFRISTRRASN